MVAKKENQRQQRRQPDQILEFVARELGNGPVLKYYFDKMQLVKTIDELVPTRPQREKLTHGEAVAALITMLLNYSHALYAMEKWGAQNDILRSIFPYLEPSDYSDDRLARTLDDMFARGLRTIHSAVSLAMIRGFNLCVSNIHHDTTSFSFYGVYEEEESEESEEPKVVAAGAQRPPHITHGYSRDRRPDLKQVVSSLSVTEEGVPILAQVHDGNFADGPNYLEHWFELSRMLGRTDFLYLGDTKLSTISILAELIRREGCFLCPRPLTVKEQRQIAQAIKRGEIRLSQLDDRDGVKLSNYSFWEGEEEFEHEGERLRVRKLIFLSQGLACKKRAKTEQRLKKARAELRQLSKDLNKRKLKDRCAIERAALKILEGHHVSRYIQVRVDKEQKLVSKQIGPGRPSVNTEYREETLKSFKLKFKTNRQALEEARLCEGIFVMWTNAPRERLRAEQALLEHKKAWKVERGHRDLKGPIALTPIYLHKPERIAALTLVCVIALQVLRLMELEVRLAIARRRRPLCGLYPNKRRVERPSGMLMLKEIGKIQTITLVGKEGLEKLALSKLTGLQEEVLELLGVPFSYYVEAINHLRTIKFHDTS